MNFTDKLKETIVSRAAEGLAASVTVLVIWAATEIAPLILPAIEDKVSKKVILSLLLASFVINFIFLIIIWTSSKKEAFKLKYGIYWDKDKNPHCPSCQKPVAAYGEYQGGLGYYCKPCKKVFPLADASGNNIEPQKVIDEL